MTLSPSTLRQVELGRAARLFQLVARLGLIAFALVPAMLLGSALAQQEYPPLSRALTVERLPGQPVYYVVGQPGIPGKDNEGHTSNAGFVVTSQGVVVFDALGTPSLGWDLLQQIRKISDQPIRYIIVSHYHADHIYGLQAFKDHSPGAVLAETGLALVFSGRWSATPFVSIFQLAANMGTSAEMLEDFTVKSGCGTRRWRIASVSC